MLAADPKPRKNGTCAQDGKRRPPAAVAAGDPFCSVTCCRKFHKVVYRGDGPTLKKVDPAVVAEMVREGRSRNDIARHFGTTVQNVTHHTTALRRAGVIQ